MFLARSSKETQWDMKREFKSPEYTPNWCYLPKVKC
ncbi:MAG: DUF4113 domain-containing protein [Oleispira sp.]|nr:DUF4113 domain-containing protein [Oleispira sp.]